MIPQELSTIVSPEQTGRPRQIASPPLRRASAGVRCLSAQSVKALIQTPVAPSRFLKHDDIFTVEHTGIGCLRHAVETKQR